MRETLRGERQNLVWKAVKKNAQLILVSTLLANAAVIFIQGFVWFASHGKYNPPTANVAIFTGLLAAAFVVTHWRK